MKRALLLLALAALAATSGCKRQKPPSATRVWLGAHGGCVATKEHVATGTFQCWGQVQAPATPGIKELAFGRGSSSCALDDKGGLSCAPAGGAKDTPARAEVLPEPAIGVAASELATCVALATTVGCVGTGRPFAETSAPWSRGAKVRAVAVGGALACVAYEGKGVVCRTMDPASADAMVFPELDVTALAAGAGHFCALLRDRTVKCWGKNDVGQLGDRTKADAAAPVAVLGLDSAARITAGRAHTCVLRGDGTVHCWGANDHHQLANGGTEADGRAQMVLGVLGVREISAGGDGTCALLGQDGEIRCWGRNDDCQLGDGSNQEHSVPAGIRFHTPKGEGPKPGEVHPLGAACAFRRD